jgi:hypothetical protein
LVKKLCQKFDKIQNNDLSSKSNHKEEVTSKKKVSQKRINKYPSIELKVETNEVEKSIKVMTKDDKTFRQTGNLNDLILN